MSSLVRHSEQTVAMADRLIVDPGVSAPASVAASPPSIAPASPFHPAPNERAQLFARTNGLIPVARRVANEGKDVRAVLSRLRQGDGLTSVPCVAPVQSHDGELDAFQIDAVARAVQTPDLLLIRGGTGTGKSRMIAEIVRQAIGRGQRVLLTAATEVAVSAVLSRLAGCAGIDGVRLGDSAKGNGDSWSPAVKYMVEKRATLERVDQIERELSSRIEQNAAQADIWSDLLKLAEHREARAAERQRVTAVAPLTSPLNEPPSNEEFERLSQCDAAITEVRNHRAEAESQLAQARHERNGYLPLEEAGRSARLWSALFWKARFNKTLPEQIDIVQKKIESIEEDLRALADAEKDLQMKRDETEQAVSRKRAERQGTDAVQQRLVQDEAVAELDQIDREELLQFYERSARLPVDGDRPGEPTVAAVQQALATWTTRIENDRQHLNDSRGWRQIVEQNGERFAEAWRASLNLVAGTVKSFSAEPTYLAQAFDLLIADEAHALTEVEFVSLAQHAARWVLLGEPALPIPAGSRFSSSRRAKPVPDFFARLWDALHHEAWSRDGDRLVVRLHPVSAADRLLLEVEPVADRPEIELRILPRSDDPVLAEVAFPANMSAVAAREFLFRELGEIPCRPRVRSGRWETNTDGIFFVVGNGSIPAGSMSLGQGIDLRMDSCGATHGEESVAFEFSASAGWNADRARAWVEDHLWKSDSGRTCRLDRNYRQTPTLAAWLEHAVQGVAGSDRGALPETVAFEPIPRRAPGGNRRGGAGYEINLADSSQRELLPNTLAASLPAGGFVNLAEAQAIAELARRLPRDRSVAIVSPFPAQTQTIRHFLPDDCRVLSLDQALETECDCLVLSLTRSHLSRAVTYGVDAPIMIRLLSRARSRLVVVGDPGTLARRAQWEGAIDHLDEVDGERERRWVSALIHALPGSHQPTRAPERARVH